MIKFTQISRTYLVSIVIFTRNHRIHHQPELFNTPAVAEAHVLHGPRSRGHQHTAEAIVSPKSMGLEAPGLRLESCEVLGVAPRDGRKITTVVAI